MRAPLGRARTSTSHEVLSLYRDAPLAVRAHVRMRWATCPLRAVAAQLPPVGQVLDVGCGHGLLSLHAALSSPGRSVLGVDVDGRKVAHARAAAARARYQRGVDCDIAVAPPGELPEGPWDGVAIVDVLYLLHADAQRRLVVDCARRVAPGGVLAVKEMALGPPWKFRWNKAQETLAVRVLGITEGGGHLTFVGPSAIGEWMAAAGLTVSHLSLQRGYPHPHHLVLGRR
ncbi:MAG TPA: class I SAM-dependent methyltransferase [Acidimicrobiales bacterium]|nr:class I SAM-dependent methyltransferase [Acidimicrobiales bacterium]